jgi:hypothetical protein
MSTPSGDSGNPWTQPGEPTGPAPQPAPSGYGTPSSPSYGKYGQGQAAPPAPPAPPAAPGQPQWSQPAWGQSGYVRQDWPGASATFRPSNGLARWVAVLSVLYTVVTWLTVIVTPADSPSLEEAVQGSGSEELTIGAAEVIALGAVPILLGAWILTSIWLVRARSNAVLLNPQSQRRSEGWVWFGWVLPIIYLWFPKQILDDTARVTIPASGDTRPIDTNLYWSLWVTSILLGAFGSMLSILGTDETLVRSLGYAEAAVLTITLLPWIRLVNRISAAQDQLAAKGPVRSQ